MEWERHSNKMFFAYGNGGRTFSVTNPYGEQWSGKSWLREGRLLSAIATSPKFESREQAQAWCAAQV